MENTEVKETKKRNTNRISVIEYKGQLFRTEDELKVYKQQELVDLFSAVTHTPEDAVALIDGLIDNVITTKQKLIDFRDLLKTYMPAVEEDESTVSFTEPECAAEDLKNAGSEDESERF